MPKISPALLKNIFMMGKLECGSMKGFEVNMLTISIAKDILLVDHLDYFTKIEAEYHKNLAIYASKFHPKPRDLLNSQYHGI